LNEDGFWKSSPGKSLNSDDDDKKLYAPPPGEEGAPRKIVAPLGSGDILFFLLLSTLAVGKYLHRRTKLAV
jgi:hypothetical protein